MHQEVSLTVDRGRYPDAVTPWEQEPWRTAALGWVRDRLADRGLRAGGTWTVRLRPWSVLLRVPVAGADVVWFKASPPAGAFEGPLTAALARWVPEHVLEPLAFDAGRGWVLLPDGGELFRTVLDRQEAGPRAWEDLLRRYADLQRRLASRVGQLKALGVPGVRTEALADVFERVVAQHPALRTEERRRLEALRPRVAEWCARLAACGIPDSLDHADLHDGQVLVPEPGRFTVFDWGDAVLAHPFCSLTVPARKACERHGPDVLPRLRDAYLEPWTGPGRPAAELRRAVSLAWRLSALGRVGAWGRVFPGADGASGAAATAAESAHSLLEILEEPP